MQGYKKLLSYKLATIAFDLTWELAPILYPAYEDSRQRSQLKQAARSLKQNNVEGSEERSLSGKLKLWDVARASGGELIEDCEDFLRQHNLSRWHRDDARLVRLRAEIEGYRPSPRSSSSCSPCTPGTPPTRVTVASVLKVARGTRSNRGTRLTGEELETALNYLLDALIRCGYLLDKQINATEKKHQTEGGYTEKLYRKRKQYRGY
jgi:four helix bundle suffix protein